MCDDTTFPNQNARCICGSEQGCLSAYFGDSCDQYNTTLYFDVYTCPSPAPPP